MYQRNLMAFILIFGVLIEVAIGAGLSGITVNPLYQRFIADGHPQLIWLVPGYDRVWRPAE